ncbi:MAG: SH3 domain-containing protein [Lachnospiraceae bacterium]|nr:SH3 domain-containing protein [Lachnospiraceae bacterium]MDE7203909.1 SH3 domain-containing protein [Lachnospiraceae bacterium]
MRKGFKKTAAVLMAAAVLFTPVSTDMAVYAKGPTYTAMQDVYYTKDNCVVYAEPTYTSTVLTTLGANLPVKVIGEYSNGWYRIDIGVICYVKMDSLTSAGAIGIKNNEDKQIADAQRTAAELGYEFVYLTLNKQKVIKKDIYNSYVGKKVILYTKIDDELGVSFKMLYEDKVKRDIDLNVTKTSSVDSSGARTVQYLFNSNVELNGQLAIFQFKSGYDKAVDIYPSDVDTGEFVMMNTYYTEFSEFAYAPVTQVADMMIVETEIPNSLNDNQRAVMADLRKGIKYQGDDTSEYRRSVVHGKLRKDTEYVDYQY